MAIGCDPTIQRDPDPRGPWEIEEQGWYGRQGQMEHEISDSKEAAVDLPIRSDRHHPLLGLCVCELRKRVTEARFSSSPPIDPMPPVKAPSPRNGTLAEAAFPVENHGPDGLCGRHRQILSADTPGQRIDTYPYLL